MRFLKSLAKWFTGSSMLLVACLCASGSVGCGDEAFSACECAFPGCSDAMGMPAAQDICTEGDYTYEKCGLYCKNDVAPALAAQGFTNCGEAQALAKNSCSVGTPVGE